MAIKKQTSNKNEQVGMICLHCGSEMQENKFYKSRSKVIDSSRFSICKNCAVRLGNADIETLHDVLRVLNISFIPEVYKEGLTKESLFSYYMTVLNNPNKKHTNGTVYQKLEYADSPTLDQIIDVDGYIYATNEKLTDLYELFGNWWSKEQLIAMNGKLDKMFVQYGGDRDNMAYLDLYCELIRLEWLSMERYAKADSKEGKALSDTRQKLLKDNGMNVQAMKEKNNNDSIGERIDWVEYEPILPQTKYYDIDGIMFMWQKLIDQMLRFKGWNKKPVDEDAMEMMEYAKTHENYSKDME